MDFQRRVLGKKMVEKLASLGRRLRLKENAKKKARISQCSKKRKTNREHGIKKERNDGRPVEAGKKKNAVLQRTQCDRRKH